MLPPLFPFWEQSDRDYLSLETCQCMASHIQTLRFLGIRPRPCCANQQHSHPTMASLPTGSSKQASTGHKPLTHSNALILGQAPPLPVPTPFFCPVSPGSQDLDLWIKTEPASPTMPPLTQPWTPLQEAPVLPFPLAESPPPLTQKRKRGSDTPHPACRRPPPFQMMGYPLAPYPMRRAGASDDPFDLLSVEVSVKLICFIF